MKILYGVSGEGFGHSSRAKEILPFLLNRGHKVMVVTYGQAYEVLKNFKGIEVLRVEGIELFFKEGRGLSLKRTLFYNLEKITKNIKNFGEIKKSVDAFKPDFCISDMEPMTPILRYWKKLPLICLDNQHRLTHLPLKVPKQYHRDFIIAKEAVRRVVSIADAYIVLSFTKGKVKKDKGKTFIVDPILRENILNLRSTKGNYVLVYLTKKDDKILAILKGIKEKFVLYGYNIEKKDRNLEFRKTGDGFLKDLAGAKAIIASAGFTLMSEALYLKKPYFAIPLKGQFEQTLNALFLQAARYGAFSEEPTSKDIRKFLSRLNSYENKLKKHTMNAREVFAALDKVLEELKEGKQQLY